MQVDLLRCDSIGISRKLTRERTHWRIGYQKSFYKTMQKPSQTTKHDQEQILKKFINFNGGLMRLKRKASIFKGGL